MQFSERTGAILCRAMEGRLSSRGARGLVNTPVPISSDRLQSVSDHLNQSCFCITLDRASLCEALEREAGDPEFCETFIHPRAHLFSNVPVFLPAIAVAEMQEVVAAVEATSRLAAYQTAALSWAPEIARMDHGPLGALMGYDFHLGEDGPRLIEAVSYTHLRAHETKANLV